MAITDEEKRILDEWPVITREELLRINQYFPHYLFWRKEKWDGGVLWRIACSCCGKRLELQEPRRIETPEEREFLGSLAHREKTHCPWCGADVTMISLSRAGKRKNLISGTRLILLHNRDGILYADALEPYKLYDTDKDLTAVPRHWLLQRYRFTPGEVMEADYQLGEFAYSPVKGKKLKELSEKYGVNVNTIKSWIRRADKPEDTKAGAKKRGKRVQPETPKRSRGAPEGNTNAVGHPGGRAPVGYIQNHVITKSAGNP